MTFPGQYGSTWAKFEQRADGKLDFSFSGTTFMPLGAGFGGDQLRFPLPFAGPAMSLASWKIMAEPSTLALGHLQPPFEDPGEAIQVDCL